MFKIIYNFSLLLITILSLPKFIWESIRYRKHRASFAEKLGLKLPDLNLSLGQPRIWIHSISVGETKAVAPLVHKIKEQIPNASIVISTTTETGQAEAKRSMPDLDAYFYLPIDFSWSIRRLTRQIKPDLLILVESDFWYNLIHSVKKVVLVNGKISSRSFHRFQKVSFFAKRLFQKFDLLCLQSQRYQGRFIALGVKKSKIVVTGNLKFDQPFPTIDLDKWKKDLGITPEDRIITIGSTHDTEESNLLDALQPLLQQFPTLKILIVPRHPERFTTVATLLEKKGIEYARFSQHQPKHGRVILIDAMGVLTACYQLSELALVGGSFVSHVGGHNIFEPAALGVPVLFGPHMESQRDLVEIVLHGGAGMQVSLSSLATTVEQLLLYPPEQMKKAGLALAEEVHGATSRTLAAMHSLLVF